MNDSSNIDAARRRALRSGAAATVAAVCAPLVRAAQPWPQRPVKLVVGFPPGSSPDALARVLAEPLGRALGQPVIVDNKPGASGTIGVSAVAASSDGHTLGLTGNGPLTTASLFNPRLPYDVARDLRPISVVASSPFALVGAPALPAEPQAFLAYAQKQGQRLSYGSVGVGSGSHLTMELLKKVAGLQAVHVPFLGFPQVLTAILGGQIDMAFMVPSVAAAQLKAGRLRAYGVSTAARSPALPEFAPVAQAFGLRSFDVASWNAVFGPASMPQPVAARLAAQISRIVKSDDVRQRLFEQGWQALGTSPEGLVRQIRDDAALWGGVVRLTGARNE